MNLVSYSDVGHRAAYNDVLSKALMQSGLILTRDDSATAEFFPMLDDTKGRFAYRAIINLLTGKKTVGLFLRPAECFLTTALKYRVKRVIFRILRSIPNVTVLTILPFDLDPRFREVAHDWIYDPQLWDLCFIETPDRESSDLENLIGSRSDGRIVVSALGTQDKRKGFDRFARLWLKYPALRDRFLFLAAGQLSPEVKGIADDFRDAGGVLIDEKITDEKLFRLYQASDAVWSCYSPFYNQASGIFGRAFQFRKPAIVREGSFLVMLAERIGYSTIAISYDNLNSAAELLLKYNFSKSGCEPHADAASELRRSSIDTLTAAFAHARAEKSP